MAADAGIDDDLVGAAENPLHGLEIHALARDVRRLLVLLVDLVEARRLALGFRHGLLTIGLGILGDLGGTAAGLRYDAVGIGLRLVLRAFEIGARGLHVAERVDDLGRRIDFLQLDLLDQDAGAVVVESLLHELLHGGLSGLARAGEDRLDIVAADHLAHGAFGHRLHGALGILDVEEVVPDAGRFHPPQHREIDVDDVLVAGEHQALLGHVAYRRAAPRILDQAHADVDLVDAKRLRRERRLDRIRQVIIEARLHLAHELAEPQHHAQFVRLDAEEAGKAPQHHGGERDQREAAAAEIARQHGAQLVLAPAQQFFEIGRARPRRLWPGAPRPL